MKRIVQLAKYGIRYILGGWPKKRAFVSDLTDCEFIETTKIAMEGGYKKSEIHKKDCKACAERKERWRCRCCCNTNNNTK